MQLLRVERAGRTVRCYINGRRVSRDFFRDTVDSEARAGNLQTCFRTVVSRDGRTVRHYSNL